jgi:hypothetical protein
MRGKAPMITLSAESRVTSPWAEKRKGDGWPPLANVSRRVDRS